VRKIREILRLKAAGMSGRQIAAAIGRALSFKQGFKDSVLGETMNPSPTSRILSRVYDERPEANRSVGFVQDVS
jgi:hypothetical protein